REHERHLDDLLQAEGQLRRQLLAQEFLGLAHRRDIACLLLAAVPASRRHRQRTREQRRDDREQRERDDELDQREAGVARKSHRVSFAPNRVVASESVRLPPEGASKATSTLTLKSRRAIDSEPRSVSGLTAGGAYGTTCAVHSMRPSSKVPCVVPSRSGWTDAVSARTLSATRTARL